MYKIDQDQYMMLGGLH